MPTIGQIAKDFPNAKTPAWKLADALADDDELTPPSSVAKVSAMTTPVYLMTDDELARAIAETEANQRNAETDSSYHAYGARLDTLYHEQDQRADDEEAAETYAQAIGLDDYDVLGDR